jgi:uncharacterized Zn finger protein/superfamily II DNA or RNA helicase
MARRSKKTYGATPWGARLRAQLVSMGGRIERGEALARTGKVFDTALRNGRLTSRVKGSFSPFYDVSLRFTPVPAAQLATVRDIVSGDLLLTVELISGNLPVSLLDAMEDAGVVILPQSFAELSGQCNCPDNEGGGGGGFYGGSVKGAGDPCKHQAACMFELIGELDKNPRTLLELRRVDLNAVLGLADEGADASERAELPYPLPIGALCPPPAAAAAAAGAAERRPPRGKMAFPHLQRNASVILQTLAPSPLFSTEDFSAVMATFYAALSEKSLSAAIGGEAGWESELDIDAVRPVLERARYALSVPDSLSVSGARVVIESDLWDLNDGGVGDGAGGGPADAAAVRCGGEDAVEARDAARAAKAPRETLSSIPHEIVTGGNAASPRVTVTLDTLRRLLLAIPGDGTVGSDSYLFLSYSMRAALMMFSSANMVPDVAPAGPSGAWTVFYRPFASNRAVAECMRRLEVAYPGEGGCVWLRTKAGAGGAVALDATTGVLHALGVFLTHLVCEFNFCGKKGAPPVRQAFFNNEAYSPATFSDKSNGLVAKRWLSVFGLLSLEAKILIKLDETRPGKQDAPYSVELFFRDAQKEAAPAPLAGTGAVQGELEMADVGTASPAKKAKARSVLVDPLREGWSMPREYMASGSRQSRDALKFVVALKSYIPEVRALLQDGRAEIAPPTFEQFIIEKSGVLRGLGTTLLLPKGVTDVLKPRLVTELTMADGAEGSTWKRQYLRLAALLSFNYRVMLGDEAVDLDEFQQMVASGRRLFQFKGKFVELDPQKVAAILAARNGEPKVPESAMELLRDVLSGDLKYSLSDVVAQLVADIQRVERPAVPESLSAELRPYQVRGYQWMLSNLRSVGGAALCDDMGLGKTVQTIAVILALKDAGHLEESPALVVCPTSLLRNWTREMSKFAPSLWVQTHGGPGRAATFKAAVGGKRKRSNAPEVILLSHGTVRRDIAALSKHTYPLLVIDEAQAIKTQATAVARAAKKLGSQAGMRLALTGTVVENRLQELHSCFDFIMPGYLGKAKEFSQRFGKPIEQCRDQECLDVLRRMTAPFMLRRVKADPAVIADLPEKVETKQYVTLSQEQVALYESIRESVFDMMAQDESARAGTVGMRSSLILKLLSDLKQICNHPACYGDRAEDVAPGRSQKCLALFDLLTPIIEGGEKVLVFSQYVTMCRILEAQIAERFGVRPLVFEGSLSPDQRDAVLRRFDNDPARQVLILSLKAGGVGLNLTSANHGAPAARRLFTCLPTSCFRCLPIASPVPRQSSCSTGGGTTRPKCKRSTARFASDRRRTCLCTR